MTNLERAKAFLDDNMLEPCAGTYRSEPQDAEALAKVLDIVATKARSEAFREVAALIANLTCKANGCPRSKGDGMPPCSKHCFAIRTLDEVKP